MLKRDYQCAAEAVHELLKKSKNPRRKTLEKVIEEAIENSKDRRERRYRMNELAASVGY